MIRLACRRLAGETGHQGAWKLLEELYREETGEDLPPVVRTERGKPYFPDSPYHFSLSHTPRHAVCVLSDRNVGVDAEETDRRVHPGLAGKILSVPERERVDRSDDPRLALLRLWVLKEAAAKLTGEGLRGYPNQTDFSPEDSRVREIDGCLIAVLQEETEGETL